MIDRIHISRFKCFDRLTLPLLPLTLLTGFNAGGKSTVIQTLLLLAQSLRSAQGSRRVAINGTLAELGTAAEVIRDSNRTMELGAENAFAKLVWTLGSEERATATALDVLSIEGSTKTGPFSIHPDANFLRNELPSVATDLLDAIRSVIFISAIRANIKSTFPSPEDVEPIHADVGPLGQFAPWWLATLSEEEVPLDKRHMTAENLTLRGQVGAWASELFPGAEVNAAILGKTGLVELGLRRLITDDWRRPANIGYGLTYAFPILVAGLLAEPGQILIIDSPEAHLHPRAQSTIAVFLATMVKAGVQIILESHSDHVLNGVRLAVKNGLVRPDQVGIHFFTGGEGGAPPVIAAQVDAHGGVSDWPDGFFDQAEKDMARLAGWN